MQVEHCFSMRSDQVDVRWTMVVRVGHDPQFADAQNCGHESIALNAS
jgi:hypothetical protein